MDDLRLYGTVSGYPASKGSSVDNADSLFVLLVLYLFTAGCRLTTTHKSNTSLVPKSGRRSAVYAMYQPCSATSSLTTRP